VFVFRFSSRSAARLALASFAVACVPLPAAAQAGHAAFKAELAKIAAAYLAQRGKPEHISTVSVSVSFPGDPDNVNVAVGRVSFDPASAPVTPESLFDIGSITKSFTSATILQLEAEGKLSIDEPIGVYLPQYPAWRNVTIRRLLNMTSGILGYDNVPAMGRNWVKWGPHRRFSDAVLVGFADPAYPGAPAPTTGWNYSNTNYILLGMIIERVTGNSYTAEITRRFFGAKYGLESTYYSPTVYPQDILARLVSGYFWNTDSDNVLLKKFVGADVKAMDMSWAASAGGIVSRPQDVTHWARALYTSDLLPPKQRHELETLVSDKTGKPLADTSAQNPTGFGLGVGRLTVPKLASFWYYQGETLGYRMVYFYAPERDIVVAVGVNSQPSGAANKVGGLLQQIYRAAVK
jgi:D-alanyl-D-alanine carboxypeptidase